MPAPSSLSSGTTYRRRSFPWRRPVRVHVEWRGAIAGMVLCEQPAFATALALGEVEMQVRAVCLVPPLIPPDPPRPPMNPP